MGLEERFDISLPEETSRTSHRRPGRRPRHGQGRSQGMTQRRLPRTARPTPGGGDRHGHEDARRLRHRHVLDTVSAGQGTGGAHPRWDPSRCPSRRGRGPRLRPDRLLRAKEVRRQDRFTHLGFAAAADALADAGRDRRRPEPLRGAKIDPETGIARFRSTRNRTRAAPTTSRPPGSGRSRPQVASRSRPIARSGGRMSVASSCVDLPLSDRERRVVRGREIRISGHGIRVLQQGGQEGGNNETISRSADRRRRRDHARRV